MSEDNEGKFVPPEELIRKLSKTVLHAAEKGRVSLFTRLTAKSSAKIAKLMQNEPILFENQEKAPREILLDTEIAGAMPEEFFENPTGWLESRPNIDRSDRHALPDGTEISQLMQYPYDVSKVKEFELKTENSNIKIISKRIDPDQLEEIVLAQRAYESGIPTPKILGIITDHGNNYALFETFPCINGLTFGEILDQLYRDIYDLQHPPIGFDDDPEVKDFDKYAAEHALTKDTELHNRLKETWDAHVRRGREHVFKRTLYHGLEEVGYKEDPDAFNRLQEDLAPFHQELENFLQEHNVTTLQEYCDFLDKLSDQEWRNAVMDPLFTEDNQWVTIYKKLKSDWFDEIRRIHFGFSPEEYERELESIKMQCLEKGIEHKDFQPRNMLIPWDFEKNRPVIAEGKPKVYLIDWEPKPKTPKGKQ